MNKALQLLEEKILAQSKGKFSSIKDPEARNAYIAAFAKRLEPKINESDIQELVEDINDLGGISVLLIDEDIEDIMINNVSNVFIYNSKKGKQKVDIKFETFEELERFVNKLKLYATNEVAKGNILDVHLPNGSRCNIVTSPLGYDITIRNFKPQALSVLDLVNGGTLDYDIAARLWLYIDGLKVRPANLLIGGIPAAGKTTLLNSLFSFFRPEQRIVTIEETYELDTRTQENCVKLETSEALPLEELVKNALRMRPDTIIIGEVRGAEANDMMTAMNIGKIAMGTIHASSTRDIINRLQHTPMNVPQDIIPVIDALMVVAMLYIDGKPVRKVVQMSEISGIETKVLLSDLYQFDYKTHRSSPILPSVTYRDTLAKLLGIPPSDILAEEKLRAQVLQQLNNMGRRDLHSINLAVRDYYDNPEKTLRDLGIKATGPVIKV